MAALAALMAAAPASSQAGEEPGSARGACLMGAGGWKWPRQYRRRAASEVATSSRGVDSSSPWSGFKGCGMGPCQA